MISRHTANLTVETAVNFVLAASAASGDQEVIAIQVAPPSAQRHTTSISGLPVRRPLVTALLPENRLLKDGVISDCDKVPCAGRERLRVQTCRYSRSRGQFKAQGAGIGEIQFKAFTT